MEHTAGKLIYNDHRNMGSVHEDWHDGFTIRDSRNHAIGVIGHIDAAIKDDALANTEFIVRAWNNHEALLQALRDIKEAVADRDNELEIKVICDIAITQAEGR